MTTITGHYNVTVNSRYYVFLQEDLESAEPDVLMANVEKKRELRKESKTKAKKEKRSKQVAEATKESVKVDNTTEEIIKPELEIVEQHTPEVIEGAIDIQESIVDDRPIENKPDRGSSRGRGGGGGGGTNNRRQNGGPRRGGYPRNEDRTYNNDENSHQKSQDSEQNKFISNNRGSGSGRPYRKDRPEFSGESSSRIGYFEENSSTNSRGNSVRRRPSGRPSGRFNRGGGDRTNTDRQPYERSTFDRNGNERYNNDRNGNERNGFDKNRVDNDENIKNDIIPENMGTFEDMSSRPPRSSRGRYPRSFRGGFNRYHASNNENDFENNKIGYFDENMENREFRGGRGRSRGRGMRRGRGEPWRQRGSDREENHDDGSSNNMKTETYDVPTVEKWPECDEELDPESNNNEPIIINTTGVTESDFNDLKKSNWGEIEDDPVELKPSNEHMTLEEYRALHGKERVMSNQEGKETRKANDGQDVFSGMEEYRKGRLVEEQGDDHDNHENQHVRQKQPIPLAIRFSRNTEYGGDSNNFEQPTVENRNFNRGYYKAENKYRGDNSSSGDRGRSRGGSDFNTYGRGRDFNRGRGRFNRNPYPVKRKEDQDDGININLGNEDEFPTLS